MDFIICLFNNCSKSDSNEDSSSNSQETSESTIDNNSNVVEEGVPEVFKKIYAALKEAVTVSGRPVVILAQTIKGYDLGSNQASNPVHNKKKMNKEELQEVATILNISLQMKKQLTI